MNVVEIAVLEELHQRVAELEAKIKHVEGKKETIFEVLTNTIKRRDARIKELETRVQVLEKQLNFWIGDLQAPPEASHE